jgi:hypothetical protein
MKFPRITHSNPSIINYCGEAELRRYFTMFGWYRFFLLFIICGLAVLPQSAAAVDIPPSAAIERQGKEERVRPLKPAPAPPEITTSYRSPRPQRS